MAIVQMQKVRLLIHRSVTTDVLRAIQKLGAVEFTEVTEKEQLTQREKSAFEFNYVSSRLDFAVEFLSRFEKKRGKLAQMLEGDRVTITGTRLYRVANSFYYNEIIDSAQDIQTKLNNSQAKLKALEEERELLQHWITLNESLSSPRETSSTKSYFLKGSRDSYTDLLSMLGKESVIYAAEEAGENRYHMCIQKEYIDVFESTLRSHDIEQEELPKRRGTPKEEIERILRAEQKEHKNIARREKDARKLAENLPQLKIVGDYIYWQKNKHNLISSAMSSSDVLVFEGWCPRDQIDMIKQRSYNKSPLYALEKIEPQETEETPVEIKNNRLVKPFESITRLYGLPGYKDLDPTLFLAGFFFIFFGLSLTDVGYGIILFLLTASALAFYNVPKEMRGFLTLIMFGGIASTIIGLFFGGYLGVDMTQMPAWVQALQQFDPISNPLPVFYLALGLGVLQILVGLGLKIVRESKNGDLLGGILDQGPWIALFLSLIAWGGASIGIVAGTESFYLYAVYGSLVALVLTQGRKEKNIFMKAFKGVFSLYGSISYFSDILSYSRLLALGLATSALAFAVNLIAGMVQDVPYVGVILMIAILIIGHLFNLAVNVLGAFIHSARLQFVEFFGKFIVGSGRNFKPFKREERFVTIE